LTNGDVTQIPNWANPPFGIAQGGGFAAFNVHTASDNNNYASFDGYTNIGGFALYSLNSWSSKLNNTNTLFFRFYIDPEFESAGFTPDIDVNIGLTDLGNLRDVQDTDPDNNVGPAVRITRTTDGNGGPIDLVADNGPTAEQTADAITPTVYSYLADTVNNPTPNSAGLIPGHVYDIWMDVINQTNLVTGGVETNGDLYTVELQDETIAGPRVQLFGPASGNPAFPTAFISDRDDATGASETINHLFLNESSVAALPINVAPAPTTQFTNMVRFDDFYISASGANATKPVPAGLFTP
jgi:hypothetical protein